ncbi:uncharacterized protein LOC131667227 isoform X3 [Phymastichus coffea]|uniref:uncharacterized protein LOC131667227 isoform X3 n=1 Tax=Phymastichus coffea TaxID=108790 RepID=UPI00273BB07A|nr:uncharacterized protein LOC131667227 isoform X3 [Phymastichus coffea]
MGVSCWSRAAPSREAFLDEQSRVLRWSAEVLARTDENIDAENSFLLDYDAECIAGKVDHWIRRDAREGRENAVALELGHELRRRLSREYQAAYADLRCFGTRVDRLADQQRRIHSRILELDPSQPAKLVRLRRKVRENLRKSEKMMFHDRLLRRQFIRKLQVRRPASDCPTTRKSVAGLRVRAQNRPSPR